MEDWIDRCQFGDCRALMRAMIADGVKVQTIVTSPPYWGLRSYLPDNHPDKRQEIGQEPSLAEWLAVMVDLFKQCGELLEDDGTAWVNMGDAYASAGGPSGGRPPVAGTMVFRDTSRVGTVPSGLKPKDLMGQPWRLAFALQDAGWYLRQDIVWQKSNPMPESVRDRCTKAHEYLFLLSKNERYYFDTNAMREPRSSDEDAATFRGGCYVGGETDNAHLGQRKVIGNRRVKVPGGWDTKEGAHGSFHHDGRGEAEYRADTSDGRRMRRSVWTIATQPFAATHFATFPEALVEPCVLAGSRPGDVVFDPFFGSGTTGQVAQRLGRHFLGCELNPDYEPLQRARLRQPALDLA
ncbi:DNA-methyltransferase [Burkholderia stagnalis]|uniref:Methyltransferase n=1 Tax=Burkholderia stagnalis TaxID=1503054 RepID=A0ABX9YF10_9BURK|nr:site-specific DNA-methyltransferase [Burkholderia stagnalis]RQQ48669.1 site-specific DNA-methyltransferase [Burkholderia stagnalis]RQQ60086.1 site-specific DNA-methyltransferase [Burkholderia stagnalis]RQQ60377.1 site-specific DNA-methyltransferase [Burkholderia stagnalis]RQQ75422.1 site-specific DNA-methyltransferase [Burkholderia stagnalis]RQQ80532.1 site-specific DNA-methyltransferase [Burkholderia stagnalis]